MTDTTIIKRNLDVELVKKNMTRSQVAEKLGVHPTTIGSWLSDAEKVKGLVKNLAGAIGVTTGTLTKQKKDIVYN